MANGRGPRYREDGLGWESAPQEVSAMWVPTTWPITTLVLDQRTIGIRRKVANPIEKPGSGSGSRDRRGRPACRTRWGAASWLM